MSSSVCHAPLPARMEAFTTRFCLRAVDQYERLLQTRFNKVCAHTGRRRVGRSKLARARARARLRPDSRFGVPVSLASSRRGRLRKGVNAVESGIFPSSLRRPVLAYGDALGNGERKGTPREEMAGESERANERETERIKRLLRVQQKIDT